MEWDKISFCCVIKTQMLLGYIVFVVDLDWKTLLADQDCVLRGTLRIPANIIDNLLSTLPFKKLEAWLVHLLVENMHHPSKS